MDGEVAVADLCLGASDNDLRRQGAEATRQRLARGETVETPHAVYVNVLAGSAAVQRMAALIPSSVSGRVKPGVAMRRQMFRALVALQDEGDGATAAREQIARRFGVPVWQVGEIEDEGLGQDWPLG
jgi:hypothetical protein